MRLMFALWKCMGVHIDGVNTNWLKKKNNFRFFREKKKLNNSIIYLCRLYAKGQVFMFLKNSQIFANINGSVINSIRDSHVDQFAEKEIFKFNQFSKNFVKSILPKNDAIFELRIQIRTFFIDWQSMFQFWKIIHMTIYPLGKWSLFFFRKAMIGSLVISTNLNQILVFLDSIFGFEFLGV